MANALNIDLKKGQKVELKDGRIVAVVSGYGMASFTVGTALFVIEADQLKGLLFDDMLIGQTERVSGYDIVRVIEELKPEDYFDDTTEWCKQHPGNIVFTCVFCGIYTAGKARCNECESE